MNKEDFLRSVKLCKGIYKRHSAGCCLHIVLDDYNISDSDIDFCLDDAEHEDCKELAEKMIEMSFVERCYLLELKEIHVEATHAYGLEDY